MSNNTNSKFICNICNKSYIVKSFYIKHVQNAHSSELNLTKVPDNNIKFDSDKNFNDLQISISNLTNKIDELQTKIISLENRLNDSIIINYEKTGTIHYLLKK
jgi:hypothetical protein